MGSLGFGSWEETRSKGKRRFILRYGVGLSVGYTFLLVGFLWWSLRADPDLRSQMTLFSVGAVLVFAPLFGWLWGWISWTLMEMWYHRRGGRRSDG